MPTKMYPTFQRAYGINDGSGGNLILTKVVVNDATSCYFVLPDGARDVKELKSSRTATASGFYLSGTLDTVVNIDGKTLNTEYVFVSRHGDLGYAPEA